MLDHCAIVALWAILGSHRCIHAPRVNAQAISIPRMTMLATELQESALTASITQLVKSVLHVLKVTMAMLLCKTARVSSL